MDSKYVFDHFVRLPLKGLNVCPMKIASKCDSFVCSVNLSISVSFFKNIKLWESSSLA